MSPLKSYFHGAVADPYRAAVGSSYLGLRYQLSGAPNRAIRIADYYQYALRSFICGLSCKSYVVTTDYRLTSNQLYYGLDGMRISMLKNIFLFLQEEIQAHAHMDRICKVPTWFA